MARREIALACSSVLLFGMGAALVWTGIASADEPTSVAGGTGEFQVAGATTGDDGEWVYVGEFKNDSGVDINDIVVGPRSGDGNGTNPPERPVGQVHRLLRT